MPSKPVLIIIAVLAVAAAVFFGLWKMEAASHEATKRHQAEVIADAQKRVREEVTKARDADVAAIGRERDAALARVRDLETTKRSLRDAPGATDVLPDSDPFTVLIDSVREPDRKR